MRTVTIIVAVVCLACSNSKSNAKTCDTLRAHAAAIETQMGAVNGNDDASIAAYNALVERSNKDLAALKAHGCPVLDFAP